MSDDSGTRLNGVCTAAADDDWSVTAEELPCLLDLRVSRAAGRQLPRVQGVIALGLTV